ncbi:MAG TPA: hypothetical protein VM536_16225, partial [Chloroflexia bacterium]|nr:hypothetical protein [Chloroflexia bacterium]
DAPEGQKADLARRRIPAYVGAGTQVALFTAQQDILARLAQLDPAGLRIATTLPEAAGGSDMTSLVVGDIAIALPMAGLVDRDAVRSRLAADAANAEAEIARIEGLLGNEQFVSRAKPDVVAMQRDKLAAARDRLGALQERLSSLT